MEREWDVGGRFEWESKYDQELDRGRFSLFSGFVFDAGIARSVTRDQRSSSRVRALDGVRSSTPGIADMLNEQDSYDCWLWMTAYNTRQHVQEVKYKQKGFGDEDHVILRTAELTTDSLLHR